ncbi:MAG: thermonuclease family protein, partial [Rhodospirillales bacterium]|nr:thermonuclease family protein [Rhodospirillales bacterium]
AAAAQAPTELPWRVAGVQILPEPISHGDPCVIKAVASAAGGRHYFGPLDAAYAGIDVEAAHGRTFCSVDEARDAGWRHGR